MLSLCKYSLTLFCSWRSFPIHYAGMLQYEELTLEEIAVVLSIEAGAVRKLP
jgi:hypothetical protein